MARKNGAQSSAEAVTLAALGTDLVSALGALGAATEERGKASEITDSAEAKATALIAAAEAKADEVRAAAAARVAALDEQLVTAYDAAVAAGWAAAQLRQMGYTRPTSKKSADQKSAGRAADLTNIDTLTTLEPVMNLPMTEVQDAQTVA